MLRKVLIPIVIGLLAGALLVAIFSGLASVGMPQPLTAFILSGAPAGTVLAALLPSSLLYWLVPEGGGPAAIGLFLVGAFLQVVIVASGMAGWLRYRRSSDKPSASAGRP